MKKIYSKVADELNLDKDTVEEAYRIYWKCLKSCLENIKMYKEMTEEEFQKTKHGIAIYKIGKLVIDYKRVKKYAESKEDNTSV